MQNKGGNPSECFCSDSLAVRWRPSEQTQTNISKDWFREPKAVCISMCVYGCVCWCVCVCTLVCVCVCAVYISEWVCMHASGRVWQQVAVAGGRALVTFLSVYTDAERSEASVCQHCRRHYTPSVCHPRHYTLPSSGLLPGQSSNPCQKDFTGPET